jgi:hypothetical protein
MGLPEVALAVPAEPRPEDVRATLERAVASAALGRSEQLGRFLRFVVDETLSGRGHLLKEYTIGVEALGRPPFRHVNSGSSSRSTSAVRGRPRPS